MNDKEDKILQIIYAYRKDDFKTAEMLIDEYEIDLNDANNNFNLGWLLLVGSVTNDSKMAMEILLRRGLKVSLIDAQIREWEKAHMYEEALATLKMLDRKQKINELTNE